MKEKRAERERQGPATFYRPDRHDNSVVLAARYTFWEAVHSVAKKEREAQEVAHHDYAERGRLLVGARALEALTTLRDDIFPLYEALANQGDVYLEYFGGWLQHHAPQYREAPPAGLKNLDERLREWAKRFHCERSVHWLIGLAVGQLKHWYKIPKREALEALQIQRPSYEMEAPVIPSFNLPHPDFIYGEELKDYKKRALGALEEYFEELEGRLKGQGFLKVPEKEDACLHSEWLVVRQLYGVSYQTIANIYTALGQPVGHQSVLGGTQERAEASKMEIRPVKRGRPSKNERIAHPEPNL